MGRIFSVVGIGMYLMIAANVFAGENEIKLDAGATRDALSITKKQSQVRETDNSLSKVDKDEYTCSQSHYPGDAIGSEIKGENTGAKIALFDEITRTQVGNFSFTGGLWFFDGGKGTDVEEGTRVLDFSFGNYHSNSSENLNICSYGKYFILSSSDRRFRIHFPSLAFAATIFEIKK